jgi:beta-glucosidase
MSLPIARRRFLAGTAAAAALPLRAHAEADELRGFPAGFVWGASTSAYQIEGAANEDGRGVSIWDVFARQPGRVANGDTGEVACDHYHRVREDIDLLSGGGFGAYRFSVAWPRVLPEGTGAVNARGLDFYDRLVDGLLAAGIAPWVCLYHWDLPQALQERGGWLNRDSASWFADYARVVAARLGDRVTHWAMFNEIGVHALFGHGIGTHAPGLTGLPNMLAAIHQQNRAQGFALTALRADLPRARLGTVLSLQPARASSEREQDGAAAARFDALWNRACIDPLLTGRYPDALAADVAGLVEAGDLAAIRQPVDFVGLNYYSPMYIAAAPNSLFGAWFGALPARMPTTHMGWPIVPEALTVQLRELRDRYGNPEVYVTENGASFTDTVETDGAVRDPLRIAYLEAHLRAARQALREGCALRGYFVWSLLDNFEWAEGFSRRFGLVHVDFKTLKRTPKASFGWLAALIRAQR